MLNPSWRVGARQRADVSPEASPAAVGRSCFCQCAWQQKRKTPQGPRRVGRNLLGIEPRQQAMRLRSGPVRGEAGDQGDEHRGGYEAHDYHEHRGFHADQIGQSSSELEGWSPKCTLGPQGAFRPRWERRARMSRPCWLGARNLLSLRNAGIPPGCGEYAPPSTF